MASSFLPSFDQRRAPFPMFPPEILQFIAEKSIDLTDYVSFRSVCRTWRSAALPGNAPKNLPWLLLPHNPASTSRSFYSLSTARTHTIQCDAVVGRFVCGSSFGWLALITPASAAISLWNPITKATIHLPPAPPNGFPHYVMNQIDENGDPINPDYLRPGYPLSVSMSSSPAAPDCVVFVVISQSISFVYCRIGDEAWTTIREPLRVGPFSIVLRDGRFYVLGQHGFGVVLDIDDPLIRNDILFNNGARYLIGTAGYMIGTFLAKGEDDDDLYMLNWSKDDEVNRIQLFKLEGNQWQQLESLAHLAFFLSRNHVSLVRATDCPRGRSNNVYLSESVLTTRMDELHDICIYDIEKENFELLPCHIEVVSDYSCSPTWVMPSIL